MHFHRNAMATAGVYPSFSGAMRAKPLRRTAPQRWSSTTTALYAVAEGDPAMAMEAIVDEAVVGATVATADTGSDLPKNARSRPSAAQCAEAQTRDRTSSPPPPRVPAAELHRGCTLQASRGWTCTWTWSLPYVVCL
mmetsp:Transcript_19325/g.52006  ORF Transcript_19325/g.52006 Transcript_19325/m.52006 type:complete len:137 (+) Transcript_19325:1076-1486(+)